MGPLSGPEELPKLGGPPTLPSSHLHADGRPMGEKALLRYVR